MQEDPIDDFSFDLSKPHVSREQIQSIIIFKPIKLELYRKALIHSSMQKIILNRIENNIKVCDYMKFSNERLEFLGDAVFNLVAAEYIYEKYPDKDEGFMTRMRTKIVRSSHCVIFAKYLGLEQYILTANKVLNVTDKIQVNNRVLEDAFEALIGALYKDLGFKYTEQFIKKLIGECVNFKEIIKDDNYKDILMRYTQAYGYELPIYKLVNTEGTAYNRKFTVSVYLKKSKKDLSEDLSAESSEEIKEDSKEDLKEDLREDSSEEYKEVEMGTGSGSSKKEAEQNAAKNACSIIDSSLKHIINRDQ